MPPPLRSFIQDSHLPVSRDLHSSAAISRHELCDSGIALELTAAFWRLRNSRTATPVFHEGLEGGIRRGDWTCFFFSFFNIWKEWPNPSADLTGADFETE